MNFKDYAGNKGGNNSGNKGGDNSGKKQNNFTLDDFSKNDVEGVSNMVNKYAGKSDDVLMNDLIHMVTKERKEGKLSDRDLDSFAQNAGMMMNPEQRAKLQGVIKKLKNI